MEAVILWHFCISAGLKNPTFMPSYRYQTTSSSVSWPPFNPGWRSSLAIAWS